MIIVFNSSKHKINVNIQLSWFPLYIQEQNKAKLVWASHILPFLYTPRHIFIPLCGRDLDISIGRTHVQNTRCGEISATLAETECSVSSVRVQSKGSFLVFLIIKV